LTHAVSRLSTYLIVILSLSGLGYVAYASLFPATPRRKNKVKKEKVSAPVGTVTATGTGGYEEEWIPAHHLKKKTKADGAMSSGDESSGPATRRRGKKA
jgi:hypothetical protein